MSAAIEKKHACLGRKGICICTKCRTKIDHRAGIPCQDEKCPNCGSKMLREGSYHYQLWKQKQDNN